MNTHATDDYLRRLEVALEGIPADARESILADVRAHLADAADAGRDTASVIDALGSPEDFARSAREELRIDGGTDAVRSDVWAGRLLHWISLALAVVTAVFVTFLLPMFTAGDQGSVVGEDGVFVASRLFSELGPGVGLSTLVPVALTLLPLVVRGRAGGIVGWVVAAFVTVAAIAPGLTLGGFYVPLALLLWSAMLVPLWIRRGRSRTVGRVFRILGGVVVVAPALLFLGGLLTGSLQDPRPIQWVTLLGVVAIGILFAVGVRFVDVGVAVLGAALMLLGIFDGGMLLLALWWAGGLWLTVGLCSAVAGWVPRHPSP